MKKKKRYAAKLLFQYRVVIGNVSSKKRICEESIYQINAATPSRALTLANKIGKSRENNYINNEGNKVYFEFIGVRDLLHLGIECEGNEVWYEIKNYLMPKENIKKFIPPKSKLAAFQIKT